MSSGGESTSAVVAPEVGSVSAGKASTDQVTTAASLRLDDFEEDEPPLVWQAAERTITPMFEIAAANSTAPTSTSVSKSNSELSVRCAESMVLKMMKQTVTSCNVLYISPSGTASTLNLSTTPTYNLPSILSAICICQRNP